MRVDEKRVPRFMLKLCKLEIFAESPDPKWLNTTMLKIKIITLLLKTATAGRTIAIYWSAIEGDRENIDSK